MMPSTSKKQHNFMEAIAHSPLFAKKVGVPMSVGKDFSKADKGRKFSKGGDMKKMNMGGYAGGGKMAKGGMAKSDMKEDMKMDKSQDKAMIKKAFKQHDMQEHKGGKGTSLKLKKGGKMATGGVTNGQGGYKKGGNVMKFAKGGVAGNGIINTEDQGGAYRDTMMHTAKPDHSPAKTGGVKTGNGGGYKTGGVTKSNAGGYKMGGKTSKKAYATGGTVNSGRAVAMPQGAKKPSSPVSINQLSGTFKRGGKVTPAEGRLMKNFAAENKTAMKQAKAQSNEVYSKYGNMKMKDGGSPSYMSGQGAVSDRERYMKEKDMSNGAYDAHYANEKAENEAMRNMVLGAPKKLMEGVKGFFSPKTSKGSGSVTETEKSITVSPAGKKRGGRAC
jgi:hypothetical protein